MWVEQAFIIICCSLKVIHTHKKHIAEKKDYKNKDITNKLLDYCYYSLNFDVVKCCFISFTIEEYKELIDYCISKNIQIIVLHRQNLNDRAKSKCCAFMLNNYGYYKNETKKFKINIEYYKRYIIDYYHKSKNIMEYIESKKYNYYFIKFEEFYSNLHI